MTGATVTCRFEHPVFSDEAICLEFESIPAGRAEPRAVTAIVPVFHTVDEDIDTIFSRLAYVSPHRLTLREDSD